MAKILIFIFPLLPAPLVEIYSCDFVVKYFDMKPSTALYFASVAQPVFG